MYALSHLDKVWYVACWYPDNSRGRVEHVDEDEAEGDQQDYACWHHVLYSNKENC
jgi:hypothetical protein